MTSLLASGRAMAVGTAASRVTGFLRNVVIFAVLGFQATNEAYQVANTAPNILYELLLGGILTSVIVPLLVEAGARDGDEGEAYAQRLLSLMLVVLGLASVLAVVAAPWIVDLYLSGGSPARRDLAVTFARYFLPQILFYGLSATIGAVLNTRGRFAPPMWAPVLNNLVAITAGLLFLVVPGPSGPSPSSISTAQTTVLGVGTTAGIVVMALALLPSLRASGFRWRLRTDWRALDLRRVAGLAGWTLLYVGVSQVGLLVVVRLATQVRDYTAYVGAFTIWQLPHAVVAVSVITGLLPRMSRSAVAGRLADVGSDVTRGFRLAAVLLVPAVVGFVVLGREIATVVYAHGVASVGGARHTGVVLAVFALGLLPFSAYQLQSRAFYALRDTRTPALIQCCVVGAQVAANLTTAAVLPDSVRVVGLAGGHAFSYLVGLLVSVRLLRRRLGPGARGYDAATTVRTLVRLGLAGVLAGVAALVLAALVTAAAGTGFLGALAALVVAGGAGGSLYLLLGRRMRVRELDEVLSMVGARVR